MSENRTVRVFVSSPSDVRPERLIAERVVKRLAREFSYHFRIEAVLWEREPLLATHHFQDLIVPPHETDIVVTALWSRLGVALPETRYLGAISKAPVTGTEWEFEDAAASYRERGLPELLLYRKRAKVTVELGDRAILEEQQHQSELVEEFMRRWFRSVDGKSFVAASREFTDTTEFESLLEEHLRALFRKRLTRPDDIETPATITWHQGSPYRGLESFEIEHAPIFFGRARARNEVREILERQIALGSAFVLVTGASGSGKSSLVKAGILSDLLLPGMVGRVALCRYAITRPGATTPDATKGALAALADAFFAETALPELAEAPLEYTSDRLRELFDKAPGQAAQPIRQGLSAAGQKAGLTERGEARLVVVIDQLEELFTAGIAQEIRERYVAALEALANSGLVWVIATMRSDFFGRIPMLPSLVALSAGEGTYLLTPPGAADIGQIIRRPAREAGLRFEIDERAGLSLDEVIREAATKDPASLPLLEYLLDQLWHQRSADGTLTFRAYQDLKGLEGAIGERAEQVLRDLPDHAREAFPRVLRALVTVGQAESASPTARLVPLSTFPEGSAERLLVDALIHPQARILVADGDGSSTRVRVAHEALLTHWERARLQIATDRRDLGIRARIEADEARWREAQPQDRAGLLLPPGRRLLEGEELLARRLAELDPALVAFIEGSVRAVREAERRRKLVRRSVIGALGALAIAASVTAFLASAANRTVGVVQRLGRHASDIGASPQRNLLLSVHGASLSRNGREGTLTAIDMIRQQLHTIGGRPLRGHEAAILAAAFSPDRRWLATGSEQGAIRLWDLGPIDPTSQVLALGGHKGAVHGLAFSADGRWLVSGAADGTVRLWRLTADGAKPDRVFDEGRYGAIQSFALSPKGDWLAFGTEGGNICIWKMSADGPQEEPCEAWKDNVPVMQVLFSPGGRWLAATCTGACKEYHAPVRLWDLSPGLPPRDPRRLSPATAFDEASLKAIAFNADETRLAAAYGYVAEVWDLTQENPPQHLLGRYGGSGGWIQSLSLSPDNRWLAIGSGSGSNVLLWDLTGSRQEPIALKGHSAAVNSVVFSDDGRWLATGSDDSTTRLWDLADPTLPSLLLRGQDLRVTKVVFSPGPSPRHLVTMGDGPGVRLWNVPDPLVDPVVLRGPVKPIIAGMAVSSDGNWIATSSVGDTKLVLWSTKDPRQPQRELPMPGYSHAIAFSRDGRWLAAKSQDKGVISLWSLADLSKPPLTLRENQSGDVRTLQFSPDNRWLVSGTWQSGTVNIWDVSGERPAVQPRYRCRQGEPVREPAFSADGRFLATGAQGRSARLWDLASPDPCANPRLLPHGDVVYQVVLSPDSRWAATAGFDQKGKLWDLRGSEPKVIAELGFKDRVLQAAFSPDNRWVAFGSWDQTLELLELANPGTSKPIELIGHTGRITSVSFSPDGRWLASASEDGTIRLWDPLVPTAAPVILRGHEDRVQYVGFSKDSRWIITGAYDGTVRLWRLQLGDLIGVACRTAGRDLTPAEARSFLGDERARQPCAAPGATWLSWLMKSALHGISLSQ